MAEWVNQKFQGVDKIVGLALMDYEELASLELIKKAVVVEVQQEGLQFGSKKSWVVWVICFFFLVFSV